MASQRVIDEFSALDAISQQRALTNAESMELERLMAIIEGRRVPKGLSKELARHGRRRVRHFEHRDVIGEWPPSGAMWNKR